MMAAVTPIHEVVRPSTATPGRPEPASAGRGRGDPANGAVAPGPTTRWTSPPPRACAARRRCPATSRSAIGRCCSRCSPTARAGSPGAGDGADVRSTAGHRRGAGRDGRARPRGRRPGRLPGRVAGRRRRCSEPTGILDCGNSGTTTRLVAGRARRPAAVRRPRRRRLAPAAADGPRRGAAAAMGAQFEGRDGGTLPAARRSPAAPAHADPLRDPGPQRPGEVRDPAGRPRGRGRDGRSARRSRRATTRSGCSGPAASPSRSATRTGGTSSRLRGPATVRPLDRRTSRPIRRRAAFWLVAGAIHPDAEFALEGVSANPTRRAIIDLLRRMGADIEEQPVPGRDGAGGEEPLADLVVRSSRLRADRGHRRRGRRRRSTRSRSCAWRRPSPRDGPGSSARASSGTRSPTGSRASRPGSARSAHG